MEHLRIVKIADVRTYRDGRTSEYDVHYIIQKKHWFGWLMPIWFWVDRIGYESLSDVKRMLERHLKEKGSKERTEFTVVEKIDIL